MLKYIGKRILTSIVTIWAVITIVFFLVRIMPGGPFEGEKITAEMKQVLNEKYGLDKPIGEQYIIYMKGLLKGDFGQSMKYKGREVIDTIENGFPKSAKNRGNCNSSICSCWYITWCYCGIKCK